MQVSGLDPRKKVAYVEYDFATDGGAVGDITLRGPGIEAGAIVAFGLVDVQTGLTSDGSATVALKLTTAEDVKAAAVLTSYTAGVKASTLVGTAATSLKLTSRTAVTMTIAVAALTAGKMIIALEYFVTE